MSGPLRFAIIGCGTIAPTHATVFDALPEARLVAVADIVAERARDLGRRFGAEIVTTDWRELLGCAEVDAVSICTPHGLHAPMAIAAAEAGKHILVEKPFAVKAAEADRVIAACRAAGVALGPVFQHRLNPSSVALRRAIDEGRLGRLLIGSSATLWHRRDDYYRQAPWRGNVAEGGGGALINQGIHMLDLLRWFMGPVRSVAATAATLSHDIEAEDTVSATIRFASGAVGSVVASVSAIPDTPEGVQIYGTRGSVAIAGTKLVRWDVEGERLEDVLTNTPPDPRFAGKSYYGDSHPRQIQDFVRSVLDGRAPCITGEEARGTVELVEAIYESGRTGAFVRLPGA